MTVAELRQILNDFDENREVLFAFPSGDYWGSTIAKPIREVEIQEVAYSDYHNCDKVIDWDNREHYSNDELREVVVIE